MKIAGSRQQLAGSGYDFMDIGYVSFFVVFSKQRMAQPPYL
jgi:hypothetical protein